MDIKRKTCDIRTWKKYLFFDISSTKINTLVPSHCQCAETRRIAVFWLLSQPLPHLRFNLFLISETFATQLWTALRDRHFPPRTGNISLWVSLSPFTHTKTLFLESTLLMPSRHFDYCNQSLNKRMHVCYLLIHIENLLHPLQLLYFSVCPICWLLLVLFREDS
jgi:hypothetical protein